MPDPTEPNHGFDVTLLSQEADHFYQAELGHDQRGSWFLGLCSLLLVFLVEDITSAPDCGACAIRRSGIVAALVLTGMAMVCVVATLWPLAGREASFWLPLPRRLRRWVRTWVRAKRNVPEEEAGPTGPPSCAYDHYAAHRRRAERKAAWVAWGIVFLAAALLVLLIEAVLCSPVVCVNGVPAS